MDNHKRHFTLDSILYARENAIILVIFPRRSSHQLQPLCVGLMGLFKGKLRVAQHDWMTANPGRVMSVLHLASLKYSVNQASFTAKNIKQLLLRILHGNSKDLTSVTRILI